MGKIIVVLAFVTALLVGIGWPALAIPSPDSPISINEATIWRHYLETNDLLVLVRTTIPYGTITTPTPTPVPPTENVTEAFLGRFSAVGESDFGSTAPYAYNDSGYGEAIFAIYFTAQEVYDKGILWADSTYRVSLSGNPALTWTPTYPTVTTSALQWKAYSNQEATSKNLAIKLLAIAVDLESLWGIPLLTTGAEGSILTSAGENYFTRAIPNLRTAVPAIFGSSITQPVFEEEIHAKTYETTLKSEAAWVQQYITATADLIGVTEGYIGLFLAVLVVCVMIFLAYKVAGTGAIEWGLLASIVVLIGFTRLGLISLTVLGVASLFCILLISFVLVLKRSS